MKGSFFFIMKKGYHKLSRPEKEIDNRNEVVDILERGKYITIATCYDNQPYIVTLSYGYDQDSDTIYLHSSTKGRKLDFFRANRKVSATIIEDNGYLDGKCSHLYRTVVIDGDISVVEDEEEKRVGMLTLLNHLENSEKVRKGFSMKAGAMFDRMVMLKIEILNITGKEAK